MEHYKIKVAVYIFLTKDGQILLNRRCNTGWQDGNYGLPAGHLETEETLKQGAIREMREETGITVKEENLKYVHTMHRVNRYIDVFFAASTWEGDPQIIEKDKCDDLGWFSIEMLPKNIIPSVKHAIEQWQAGIPFSEFLIEGE